MLVEQSRRRSSIFEKSKKTLQETIEKVVLLIKTKRVYELPSKDDGYRILIDRLWPRGMSKEKAKLDIWMKEIAPSDELRKRFCHDPQKWEEFQREYRKELLAKANLIKQIRQFEEERGTVTLIFSTKEAEHNNAIALKNFLETE